MHMLTERIADSTAAADDDDDDSEQTKLEAVNTFSTPLLWNNILGKWFFIRTFRKDGGV